MAAAALFLAGLAPMASATPVCTDGYKGGPPLATCGNRIFPEAALTKAYVQYSADPTGFREYADGIAFLAQKYPRFVQVFALDERYGKKAVSAGPDAKRSTDPADTGDGRRIWVIRLTDRSVPDKGKKKLFFSLSVHGNERGGLEGGLRAVEDLAIAATNPDATISDGVAGYNSATGRKPVIHSYAVRDVLAKEDVYLTDFNIDGWEVGDLHKTPTGPYERADSIGTDLNRQMPTIGRIDPSRNPLQESEMKFGTQLIDDLSKAAGGRMSYGADVHGELTSRAYVDIMYPAGQFDSVKHRQLMAIAERTKSVIDATLYAGIQNQIENGTGGDEGEGVEEMACHLGPPGCITEVDNTVPTKPAHWATVWDTLGYTDTGFIGDYLATDAAVTGMDYEIFLNHTVPDKAWNVYLQENHINATRAIVKTAMAYALFQDSEFNDANVKVETGGQAGYVLDPAYVTDTDANGPGELPGPQGDGTGKDGKPVAQRPYKASRMSFFKDEARLMPRPYTAVLPADIANNAKALDGLDSLVLADVALPKDAKGRAVNATRYYANIAAWVKRGGNLVLTDKALHALGDLGIVDEGKIKDIKVYQPYSDIGDFKDPLVAGLRANARQLVEAAILGYGIGGTASPMTAVDANAFTAAGGKVVGTTNSQVTLGRIPLGKGRVQVVGGALPTPTEDNDHRYGLRDYGLTYSGLYIMENAVRYDAPGLGAAAPVGFSPVRPGTPAADAAVAAARRERLAATGGDVTMATVACLLVLSAAYLRRRRRLA
jgi:hypothetical protein